MWSIRLATFAVVAFVLCTSAGCASGLGHAPVHGGPTVQAKKNLLPTIEERDPALASALLTAAAKPSAEHHRQVAAEYRRLGILDAAHTHFKRALAFEPRDPAAYDGMARIWRDWGFPHLGLGDAHRAVYFAPESPAARNTLGTLFQAMGQRDHARRAFEAASSLDPSVAYAHVNLCRLAMIEDRVQDAVRHCQQALAIDASLAGARADLAKAEVALARAGRRPVPTP